MSDKPSWYWDPDGAGSDGSNASDLKVAEPEARVGGKVELEDRAQELELPTVEQRIADGIAALEAEDRERVNRSAAKDSDSDVPAGAPGWGSSDAKQRDLKQPGPSKRGIEVSLTATTRTSGLLQRLGVSRRVRLTIVVALAALVVGYLFVEVAGRIVIERSAETQIRNGGASGQVEVNVGRSWWTPSITRLLLTNNLDRATVSMDSADLFMVPVRQVRYQLDDLKTSVSVRSRTVRVLSLGSGDVLVVVDPSSVSQFLGVEVSAKNGQLFVGAATVAASVRVDGSAMLIETPDMVAVNGTSLASFPIVDSYLLPCSPTAKVVGDSIELRCQGSKMPGILDQAIGPQPRDQKVDKSAPPELGPSETVILDPDGGVDTGASGADADGMGPDGAQGGMSSESSLPPPTVDGGN